MKIDIRQERTTRGWSQKEVGNRIGVTPESIHSIETGKRKPSYSVYCKLMFLFDYDIPRLVFGEAGGDASNLYEEDTTSKGQKANAELSGGKTDDTKI